VIRTLPRRFMQSTLEKKLILNVCQLKLGWQHNLRIQSPLVNDSQVFMTIVLASSQFWEVSQIVKCHIKTHNLTLDTTNNFRPLSCTFCENKQFNEWRSRKINTKLLGTHISGCWVSSGVHGSSSNDISRRYSRRFEWMYDYSNILFNWARKAQIYFWDER
jgi:hypothetical protein